MDKSIVNVNKGMGHIEDFDSFIKSRQEATEKQYAKERADAKKLADKMKLKNKKK